MDLINKQVIQEIYVQKDEDALLLLESIASSLDSDRSDLSTYNLNRTNLLMSVRELISITGIDDISSIKKGIISLLRKKTSSREIKEEKYIDRVAAPKIQDKIVAHEETVNGIEQTNWLNQIEIEALMRAEDPAYFTPNLLEITDRAKWNYFYLASAKLRILKVLEVSL